LLFVGCNHATHKIIDKYQNGQVKTEYIFPDKSDTSKYTYFIYYDNGRLKYKTEIIDNMFVGDKMSYYENGNIERIEKLFEATPPYDSVYDCHITNFLATGHKSSEYSYLANKLNGVAIDYDSIGNKSRSTPYKNGKVEGWDTLFYTNGKVRSIGFAINGTLKGYEIDFKESGDTLKWFNNKEFGENGVFRKKWLSNGNILTGCFGDTLRSYVIWKWCDKNNKVIKTKIDKSGEGKYIDPE